MAEYNLKNGQIEVCISSLGAELRSIKNAAGKEFMWDANPAYWKRTSPILFPVVGSLNQGCYRYNGEEYPMSQHGFARDMEFLLIKQTKEELVFALDATPETLEKYPFAFRLQIGYKLDGNILTVSWNVRNTDEKEMYFSIGGHPAFLCPLNEDEKQTDCRILFDAKEELTTTVVGGSGTLSERIKTISLKNGYLDITPELFDEDALIIENNQAHQAALCDKEGTPYVTVRFDAPLFGVWSPAGKNAPFICIEPWYGRCDRESFTGTLSEREWGNRLAPSGEFAASYQIEIADM